jgi:hypothetical protein
MQVPARVASMGVVAVGAGDGGVWTMLAAAVSSWSTAASRFTLNQHCHQEKICAWRLLGAGCAAQSALELHPVDDLPHGVNSSQLSAATPWR